MLFPLYIGVETVEKSLKKAGKGTLSFANRQNICTFFVFPVQFAPFHRLYKSAISNLSIPLPHSGLLVFPLAKSVKVMTAKLTLLAPARNLDTSKAAIQAGADAVYIGPPAFGARQAAGNSIEDIAALVRYARPYGVQILVTLNTLLKDSEMPLAVRMAWQLYEAGVEALIIQDLRLLGEHLPPVRLHASTQCDNRTPEQVVRLQRLGFRRAVLARELSINEIRAIRQATLRDNPDNPIELEAFVHGALCVSYSGRCFMSERLMNRSANRGECAQMCRMAYDLLDSQGNEIRDDNGRPVHQQYVLSLKDLDRSAYLGELIDAGVTTFKIEGRLKNADYVTNVVAYYRQKIDCLEGRPQPVRYTYAFTPDPARTFHRSQTDYFLHGRTSGMAQWQSPKSTGQPIGTYLRTEGNWLVLRLLPGIKLHTGDGIGYGNEGFLVNGVEGSRILPNRPVRLRAGEPLTRYFDKVFTDSLRSERRVPVRISLAAVTDGFRLCFSAQPSPVEECIQVSKQFKYPHQPADNQELAFDNQRRQLSKLGGTPYICEDTSLPDAPFFIPAGVLNDWRRQVVEQLMNAPVVTHKSNRKAVDSTIISALQKETSDAPLMTCRYCILYEMGHCRKINPMTSEPRYLRLANGMRLELRFDCARCEMLITK